MNMRNPPGGGGGRASNRDARRGSNGKGRQRPQQPPDRPDRAEVRAADRPPAPALPADLSLDDLDPQVRAGLRTLPTGLAELIGKHLMAAALALDTDPSRALEHARFARSRAARVAVVRELAGVIAYHADEWAEALAELRTARRLGGGPGQLALMADCERGLGRPERALELARSDAAGGLAPAEAVELRIVTAGARRDLGQPQAAVVELQGPGLDIERRDPWSGRLFYAYADALLATGRTDEALRWFVAAADADEDDETDAAQRAMELRG
jgi:tetratricopeptide (TPR) repeat protein